MCLDSFMVHVIYLIDLVVLVLPPDLPTLFSVLFSGDLPTRNMNGLIMIWHNVVLWPIWETCNEITSPVKFLDLLETFFAIKHFSQKWLLTKAKLEHSFFYDLRVIRLWFTSHSSYLVFKLGFLAYSCLDPYTIGHFCLMNVVVSTHFWIPILLNIYYNTLCAQKMIIFEKLIWKEFDFILFFILGILIHMYFYHNRLCYNHLIKMFI